MDQYNNRVDVEGYAVDSTGRRMPVQSPYSLRGQGASGQVVLRDDYGNRYDSRGNRIKYRPTLASGHTLVALHWPCPLKLVADQRREGTAVFQFEHLQR